MPSRLVDARLELARKIIALFDKVEFEQHELPVGQEWSVELLKAIQERDVVLREDGRGLAEMILSWPTPAPPPRDPSDTPAQYHWRSIDSLPRLGYVPRLLVRDEPGVPFAPVVGTYNTATQGCVVQGQQFIATHWAPIPSMSRVVEVATTRRGTARTPARVEAQARNAQYEDNLNRMAAQELDRLAERDRLLRMRELNPVAGQFPTVRPSVNGEHMTAERWRSFIGTRNDRDAIAYFRSYMIALQGELSYQPPDSPRRDWLVQEREAVERAEHHRRREGMQSWISMPGRNY